MNSTFLAYIIVAVGGAIGAMTRVFLGSLLPATYNNFPLRIIAVNILGCFAMGIIYNFLNLYYQDNTSIRVFLTTGFLGGLTTFSSFALEYAQLQENNNNYAMIYVITSVVLGIAAYFIGAKIIKLF